MKALRTNEVDPSLFLLEGEAVNKYSAVCEVAFGRRRIVAHMPAKLESGVGFLAVFRKCPCVSGKIRRAPRDQLETSTKLEIAQITVDHGHPVFETVAANVGPKQLVAQRLCLDTSHLGRFVEPMKRDEPNRPDPRTEIEVGRGERACT